MDMENKINELLSKYSKNIIKNIDIENTRNIINYLLNENCKIIDDIMNDYLDVFTIEFNEFKKKVEYLNKKYNNKYFDLAENDLNYLEELFNDI